MQASDRCPFSPNEISQYRAFEAYDFDGDAEFQREITLFDSEKQTILPSREADGKEAQLQAKLAYFIRKFGVIDLRKYTQWREAVRFMSSQQHPPAVIKKELDDATKSRLAYTLSRFKKYNFEDDTSFQKYMANLSANLLNNARICNDFDSENFKLLHAKVIYFDQHILPLSWEEYLETIKSANVSTETPTTCPITGNVATIEQTCPVLSKMTDRPVSEQPSFNPNDTTLLVHARPMRVGNSTGGLDEVVMYESQHWNEKQLYKLKKTLTKARQKGQAAAVLLTSDAGQPPMHDAANDRIRTHDWRIFSPPPIDKAAAQRYAHLLDEAGSNKGAPFVAVFNGCVHSAAMNWFRAATARVCTEHVIISPARIASTDETLVYSPVFGLYTLTHLHGPVGIEFYLQFNPSVRLRAPDCLLLGLVDRFVPEKYLGDWLRRLRAAFPLGSKVGAATAQQLQEAVLTGDKHWPGCGVIDCWKAEIEHCFGETTSLEQMLDRVGQLSKPWALATIDYVRSLPPLLAKIMYEAIQQGKLLNWHECNQLESVIAANWSQSTDAHRLSAFQTTRIQPTWKYETLASVSTEILNRYFKPSADDLTPAHQLASNTESIRDTIETLSTHCYKSPWHYIDASVDYSAIDASRAKCPYFQG